MHNKKLPILIVILIIILVPLLLYSFVHSHKQLINPTTFKQSAQLPDNGSFVQEDTTTSPKKQITVVNATITRFAKKIHNQIWSEFTLTDNKSGSQRILYNQESIAIQYEQMTLQNWSPTDRFFYIFYDYPDGRRNLLMFQTDGRFTDTKYYLIPIILTDSESITHASWFDNDTLHFDLKNRINSSITHFQVDLDDSTGVVTQIQN